MGVFPYSLEPGTPAEKLDGHLPEEVKQARCDELMELQQDIAFRFSESLVGYELDAIIDEKIEEGVYLGRVFADAPEIDGNIYVAAEELEVGQLVPVEIEEARGYDLAGVFVDE
jgi:ribosomal protein S12 methylthiotransferase